AVRAAVSRLHSREPSAEPELELLRRALRALSGGAPGALERPGVGARPARMGARGSDPRRGRRPARPRRARPALARPVVAGAAGAESGAAPAADVVRGGRALSGVPGGRRP